MLRLRRVACGVACCVALRFAALRSVAWRSVLRCVLRVACCVLRVACCVALRGVACCVAWSVACCVALRVAFRSVLRCIALRVALRGSCVLLAAVRGGSETEKRE